MAMTPRRVGVLVGDGSRCRDRDEHGSDERDGDDREWSLAVMAVVTGVRAEESLLEVPPVLAGHMAPRGAHHPAPVP
jgi:hypothetical protein